MYVGFTAILPIFPLMCRNKWFFSLLLILLFDTFPFPLLSAIRFPHEEEVHGFNTLGITAQHACWVFCSTYFYEVRLAAYPIGFWIQGCPSRWLVVNQISPTCFAILHTAGDGNDGFKHFLKVFALVETTKSIRIWTRLVYFIFCADNHYVTLTPNAFAHGLIFHWKN